MKKKKLIPKQKTQDSNLKDFIDLISPAAIKFSTDHFILGDTYRSVWAIRELLWFPKINPLPLQTIVNVV